MSITYKQDSGYRVYVYLDKAYTGTIVRLDIPKRGWRYIPLGKLKDENSWGKLYPTLQEVKKSLEENHE